MDIEDFEASIQAVMDEEAEWEAPEEVVVLLKDPDVEGLDEIRDGETDFKGALNRFANHFETGEFKEMAHDFSNLLTELLSYFAEVRQPNSCPKCEALEKLLT